MLTKDQEDMIKRLKSYYPFRVVFGAVHPVSGKFEAHAMVTKARMNKLAREGWNIYA